MIPVGFYRGTIDRFKKLDNIDENGLYFLTNGQLYYGDKLVSVHVEEVESFPSSSEKGYILVNSETEEVRYYTSEHDYILLVSKRDSSEVIEARKSIKIGPAFITYDEENNEILFS